MIVDELAIQFSRYIICLYTFVGLMWLNVFANYFIKHKLKKLQLLDSRESVKLNAFYIASMIAALLVVNFVLFNKNLGSTFTVSQLPRYFFWVVCLIIFQLAIFVLEMLYWKTNNYTFKIWIFTTIFFMFLFTCFAIPFNIWVVAVAALNLCGLIYYLNKIKQILNIKS